MSEDTRTPFGDQPSQAPGSYRIAADNPHTAFLVEATGWPSDGIVPAASAAAAAAHIHAFDWRRAAPARDVLDALPGDAAILALVSLETIDVVDVLLHGRNAACVFGDAPVLIAIALSDLDAVLGTGRAFDPNRAERARLQALALELARLAEQLGAITTGEDDAPDTLADRSLAYRAEVGGDRSPSIPPNPQRIRHLISIRRLRERFFSSDLFADPAWDILLDLAASRLEHRSVSVSSLCIAAAVPPTTALRWIRLMTEQQLLERRADPVDARRMFVDLSDSAFDQLCGWFALVDERGGLGG
ncbi:winged helix DNA-binding protein [Blastomonas sp.]|uniref:winged helix DNA-binding protein n=1 Tax=Blastomonas sp. TaxID=1909299 RepID=UPI00261FAE11|nr:winged helix DNA-binding protein [Blastomonas sp.]MDM7954908.1 winged helix DNA-binding protein [Blastomonas sp.]